MAVGGKNILNNFANVQQLNAAPVETDLAQAQMINTANLKAVDDLFSKDLLGAVDKINRTRAGGTSFTAPANGGLSWLAGINKPSETTYSYTPQHDDNHSFEQVRSKFCVQSLALDDWEKFAPVCKGSVIKSPISSNDESISLDTSYDDLLKQRKNLKPDGDIAPFVCALRNHIQKNQVYWMTTSSVDQ